MFSLNNTIENIASLTEGKTISLGSESKYLSYNNKKIIIVLSILVLLVTILQIWTINRLATYGEQITKLEISKSSLQLENQILKSKIAQKSSLLEAEKNSSILGFEKINNLQYLQPAGLALSR